MESIEYQVTMDGNAWVCHGPNFVNIQESIVGWGDTEEEAIIDYCRAYINQKYS